MKSIALASLILGWLCFAAQASPPGKLQYGMASWYGSDFKKTANGERYNPESMTAAHRSLPFGTWVRVTHLKSQRSAEVRINNRGPYAKGRIIDVSRAAARVLDMVRSGVARVKVEVIDRSDSRRTPRRASRVSESGSSDSRR